MSKKRIIAVTGITILSALALLENATRSVTIQPATVRHVVELVPDAGPDRFQVAFETMDGTAGLLVAQSTRPTLQTGDVFCLRIHKRSWAAPKYQKSAQTTC